MDAAREHAIFTDLREARGSSREKKEQSGIPGRRATKHRRASLPSVLFRVSRENTNSRIRTRCANRERTCVTGPSYVPFRSLTGVKLKRVSPRSGKTLLHLLAERAFRSVSISETTEHGLAAFTIPRPRVKLHELPGVRKLPANTCVRYVTSLPFRARALSLVRKQGVAQFHSSPFQDHNI